MVHEGTVLGARHVARVTPRLDVRRWRRLRLRTRCAEQHRDDALFEVPARPGWVAVLVGEGLALLGEPQATAERARGLSEDRARHRPTAPAQRRAAAMKESPLDVCRATYVGHRALRLEQRKGRRRRTRVLGAIRVAQHDLECLGAERGAKGGRSERSSHHRGGGAQVVEGLKQRRGQHPRAFMAGDQQHLEQIGDTARHAHDEAGVGNPLLSQHAQRGCHQLIYVGGGSGWQGTCGERALEQRALLLLALHRVLIHATLRERERSGGGDRVRVFTQVEGGEAPAKECRATEDRIKEGACTSALSAAQHLTSQRLELGGGVVVEVESHALQHVLYARTQRLLVGVALRCVTA